MSTPTPRTDDIAGCLIDSEEVVPADFARALETELNAATAERDQLRVDLELADVMYQRECEVEHELRTEVERLRADRTYNHECINRLASATGTLGENSEKVVDVVLSTIAQLHALQLVCGTTNADKFSTWVDRANARAERAEADLAALGQSFDDNCRGVVKIADELAVERARLDWLESPAGMDWQWQAGITRATIDAKMQKDAK